MYSIYSLDIPTSANGLAMNVVAVAPTAASFLTVYPDGNALPLSSNLNYVAGQPPVPNKVDVAISAQGKLAFYNSAGSVHVVADAVSYYKSSGVTELTQIVNGKADKTAVYTRAQVDGLIGTVADAVDAVGVMLDMKADIGDVFDRTTEYQLDVVEVCFVDGGVIAGVIDTVVVHYVDHDGVAGVTGVTGNLLTGSILEGCNAISVGVDGNHDNLTLELGVGGSALDDSSIILTDIQTKWVPVPVVAP